MITDTKVPAGVTALTYTCWGLVYANGQEAMRPDYMPHYRTEEEAANDAGEQFSDRWGIPTPHLLDAPCFLAIARCGYVFDQENTAEMHHDTAEEAYRCAVDSGLRDMSDGTLRCCDDCEDCNEVS